MAAIDEGLQDVLLDVEVVVVDRREGITESWQILHGFLHAVIVDVVARGLGPQDEVIANVLLDEAVAVVAANHRVGQVHVLDLGLQLAPIVLADPAAEDHGDLVGLSDCSIGVEQAFAEIVQCRAATEDEVVAKLDLREEQPVLAAGLLPLSCSEEGREARQPLLAAGQQVPRGERVGELLKALGRRAFDEGIGALLEVDALLTHAVGQPVMLIEADAGGERKVGTDADEHPSPLPVVDVEVVLDNPSVRDLQMPAVRLAVADRCHDACRFARLENDHHGIRARPFEVWIDEVVAAAFRGVQNRNVPLRCPPFQPAAETARRCRAACCRLTGYSCRYVLKKPTTRSGCWNG